MAIDDVRLDREDGRKHNMRTEDDSGGRVKARLFSRVMRKDRLSGFSKPETMPRGFCRTSKGHRMSDAIAFLKRAIEQGQGLAQADLVLKGGRIFDLVGGELIKSDVAICNDRIVGTMGEYRGEREIDVRGKVIVPGFIDPPCHVESSLLPPLEFDRCVLSHGVTTSICDPHEIANVLGLTGLH